MHTSADLDAAYRATSYVVHTTDGDIVLRIDQMSAPLDAILDRQGVRCWAFITASNPGSTRLGIEENRQREQELRHTVVDAGYAFLDGHGIGDDGTWPAEPSLLVLGIAPAIAAELGQRFGQNAVVLGERGKTVRLLWLCEDPLSGRR